MNVTDLIARLRAPEVRASRYEAADALEAQAREIAVLRDAVDSRDRALGYTLVGETDRLAAAEQERDHWLRRTTEEAALKQDYASRLAAAERDAERYRWLRVDPSLVVGPSYVLRRTDELDAAIDAFLAKVTP